MSEVRMNEVMLFGTQRIKRDLGFDACVEYCRHLHPDGRWVENFMTDEEAYETAVTDEIPDSVMSRATLGDDR